MISVGIDPGLSGALVAICAEQPRAIHVADQPLIVGSDGRKRLDVRAMVAAVQALCAPPDIVYVLEQSGCRPGQSAQSGVAIGRSVGLWEGIIASTGAPYHVVTPQRWQKVVFGGARADKKARALEMASRLFPNLELRTPRGRVLDGRADAACLAYYGLIVSAGPGDLSRALKVIGVIE